MTSTTTVFKTGRAKVIGSAAFLLTTLFAGEAQPNESTGWDRMLPTLTLENVNVNAESLPRAWQQVSKQYFLRSVLYLSREMGGN